jgi:hypothetical protein
MIAITKLTSLKNNDGLTLKNGEIITYKSGWQVATEGMQTTSPKVAMVMIKLYKGNCGIWFSDGIYYIDKSHRVSTKREAMEIGRACNQISVLNWKNMSLAYC